MIVTIELEDVAKLIKNGTVNLLDIKYCQEFDKFVSEQYPWDFGYGDLIDWDATPGFKQIKDVQMYSLEAKNFIKSTSLSNYAYIAIIYGASEPGIIGRFDDVINNLSGLSSHTPWVEFMVGAIKNKYGIYELINNDFIEIWTGKCTLTAPDFSKN